MCRLWEIVVNLCLAEKKMARASIASRLRVMAAVFRNPIMRSLFLGSSDSLNASVG